MLTGVELAESTGSIVDLGRLVLRSGCQQIAQWANDERTEHLEVHVNISQTQIERPDFVSDVCEILETTGANARRLKIELTESMPVKSLPRLISTMKKLSKIGIRFSLDDFGTGYSCLSYLNKLPVCQLKIDQSFVQKLNRADFKNLAITSHILQLSNSLGISVIAEGVETLDQFELLEKLGCDRFQGYFFSRTVSVDSFERLNIENLAEDKNSTCKS